MTKRTSSTSYGIDKYKCYRNILMKQKDNGICTTSQKTSTYITKTFPKSWLYK